MESPISMLQGFDNNPSIQNEQDVISPRKTPPCVSNQSSKSILSGCYGDVYSSCDRFSSGNSGDGGNSISTNGFGFSSTKQHDDTELLSPRYTRGAQSMVLNESLNDYSSLYKNSGRSILGSDNGDFSTFDDTRFSLSGNDYLNHDMNFSGEDPSLLSFGHNSIACLSNYNLNNQENHVGDYDTLSPTFDKTSKLSPYPMQRQTSHMSGILESDNLFNKSSPLYDNTLADSFLYSSPTSVPSSQSSLLNGPPLPPRNYMQSDYLSPTQQTPPPLPSRSILPTEQRPFFNSIDSNLVNLHTSTHSSTSLSSPHHGYSGYWNRSMNDLSKDSYQWECSTPTNLKSHRISGQLNTNAPPFMGAPQNNYVFTKDTEKKNETTETSTEKKKGSGEDVDINKLLSGEETRSAVMIRNIPNRFSKEELCEILDPYVEGKYTILNMPLDSKTHRNLGYSFIQFQSIEDLIVAYRGLQGKKWPNSESVKRCRFCYAKIQGDPNTAPNAAPNAAPNVATGTATVSTSSTSTSGTSTNNVDVAESVKEE